MGGEDGIDGQPDPVAPPESGAEAGMTVKFAKQRALEYIDRGEVTQGITSMMSDLNQLPNATASIMLCMATLLGNPTKEEARRLIEGFSE